MMTDPASDGPAAPIAETPGQPPPAGAPPAGASPVGTPSGRDRFFARLGRVTLLGCTTLAALVAADLLSRLVMGRAPHPIGWEFPVDETRRPSPYLVFGGRQTDSNAGYLNPLGYRGQEPTREKPLGEYRVFLLGASTLYYGDPSIPELVEAECHRRGLTGVRCYNFACVSQVTGQELARVATQVVDLHPDLVLHYSGSTDIMMPFDHDPRPGYPYNFMVYENNPLLDTAGSSGRTWGLVASKSNLVRSLAGPWLADALMGRQRLRREVAYESANWRQEIVDRYLGNLAKSSALARMYGARMVGVLQPITCYPEVLQDPQIGQVNINPYLLHHVVLTQDLVVAQAAEREARGEFDFRDLSEMFRDSGLRYFQDYAHLHHEAHPLVAEALAEIVTQFAGGSGGLAPPAESLAQKEARAWQLTAAEGAEARWQTAGAEPGWLTVEVNPGPQPRADKITLTRPLLPLAAGQEAELRFRLRAADGGRLGVTIVPYERLARPTGREWQAKATTEWQSVALRCRATEAQADLVCELQLGELTGRAEITDVSVVYGPLPEGATAVPVAKLAGSTAAEKRADAWRRARWYLFCRDGNEARLQLPAEPPGVLRVEVDKLQGEDPFNVVIERNAGSVRSGQPETVSFAARADRPRPLGIIGSRADDGRVNLGLFRELTLSEEWQAFTVDFEPQETADLKLTWLLGSAPGLVELREDRLGDGAALELRAVDAATAPFVAPTAPSAETGQPEATVPSAESD